MKNEKNVKTTNETDKKREMINMEEFLNLYDPLNTRDSAISNTLKGLDLTNSRPYLGRDTKGLGLIFITRPQLNLTEFNLLNDSIFSNWLSTDLLSIPAYSRLMLDPRLSTLGDIGPNYNKRTKLLSPLVDTRNPFIPLVTNTVDKVTGWPDRALSTKSMTPGLMGEVYSFVDSSYHYFKNFKLNFVFDNIPGSPVISLFELWKLYQSQLFRGIVGRYPDLQLENESDFDTKIYHIVLDSTQTYVVEIGAVGVAKPINVPIGERFDYDRSRDNSNQIDKVSITMDCTGVDYNYPKSMDSFNYHVSSFHPEMKKLNDTGKNSKMVKISKLEQTLFKNRVYPRINIDTGEFEWWVDKDIYDLLTERKSKRSLTKEI